MRNTKKSTSQKKYLKSNPHIADQKLRKFRGLLIPYANHKCIRAVKRAGHEPTIHGTKLWKSSCLMIDYLAKNPPKKRERVLEVGCGWGVTGIWCAKAWQSNVVSMDADPAVFPYLEAVAKLNKVYTKTWIQRFERVRKKDLTNFDILFGSDICFWDELVKPVGNMIDRAIEAGVGKIIIADPERPTFQEMAKRRVNKHGGKLVEWRITGKVKASGSLLVINNS